MVDSYAIDAINTLQAFLRDNPHHKQTNQFLGGFNNRVLTGSWQGQEVIYKFYGFRGGLHIGPPHVRQARDAEITRWLWQRNLAPEPLEVQYKHGINVLRGITVPACRPAHKRNALRSARASVPCGPKLKRSSFPLPSAIISCALLVIIVKQPMSSMQSLSAVSGCVNAAIIITF